MAQRMTKVQSRRHMMQGHACVRDDRGKYLYNYIKNIILKSSCVS